MLSSTLIRPDNAHTVQTKNTPTAVHIISGRDKANSASHSNKSAYAPSKNELPTIAAVVLFRTKGNNAATLGATSEHHKSASLKYNMVLSSSVRSVAQNNNGNRQESMARITKDQAFLRLNETYIFNLHFALEPA